tara:strand:+ start:1030 stop:1233 length:204 start_codon:yes stop_codon:yes gene_type:complete
MKPSDFPMAQSLFDDDGIYASSPELRSIALRVMEQEKRERECRRLALMDDQDMDSGHWGIWNISDRD